MLLSAIPDPPPPPPAITKYSIRKTGSGPDDGKNEKSVLENDNNNPDLYWTNSLPLLEPTVTPPPSVIVVVPVHLFAIKTVSPSVNTPLFTVIVVLELESIITRLLRSEATKA